MQIDILSLFPEYFDSPLSTSILGRAIDRGLLDIRQTNIRDFASGKHKRVDDRPYGGGPGMLMMPDPIKEAILSCRKEKTHVVFMTPQAKVLNSKKAEELAAKEHLIILCGHYEGVDQRLIDHYVDEEISIGDYVLSNGCLPALVILDCVARFVPEVLGHEDAAKEDSFQEGIFDHPHYTRPEVFEDVEVPEVLRNGHHEKIKLWREQEALKRTLAVRPELVNEDLKIKIKE